MPLTVDSLPVCYSARVNLVSCKTKNFFAVTSQYLTKGVVEGKSLSAPVVGMAGDGGGYWLVGGGGSVFSY